MMLRMKWVVPKAESKEAFSTKRQDSFKLRRKSSRTRSESDLADDALTALKEKNFESWLGGRDSNPDNVVQRALNGFWSVPVRSGLLDSSAGSLQ